MSFTLRLLPALFSAAPAPTETPAMGHRSRFTVTDPPEGYGHIARFERDIYRGGPAEIVTLHQGRALDVLRTINHRASFQNDRYSAMEEVR